MLSSIQDRNFWKNSQWLKISCGNIIIEMIINTITQTEDKKANTAQHQVEFER